MARLVRWLGLLVLLVLSVGPGYAQTAQQVLPGFLSTTLCGTGLSPCWLPYSVANPLPVTGGGGGGSLSATASASPTAVSAGPGVALNTSLFSELYTALSIGGVPISSGNPLPVTLGSGGGNVTIVGPLDGNGNVQTIIDVAHQAAMKVSQPDVTNTGSVAAGTLNSNFAIVLGQGVQSIMWNVSGMTAGTVLQALGSTATGQASPYPVTLGLGIQPTNVLATTITGNGSFCTSVGGLVAAELNVSTAGSAGTVTIVGVATVSQCPAQTVPVTVTTSDPCYGSAKLPANFSSGSSGGSIVTAVAGKRIYVCSLAIVTSAAATISFEEGTGSSVCTGGTVVADYLNAGASPSAANGASFAANGGISIGDGTGTVFSTANVNQNLCPLFSVAGSPNVVVSMSYVTQ